MPTLPTQNRAQKRWMIAGALVAAVGGGALAFAQATKQSTPTLTPIQTLPADVAANRAAEQPAAPAPAPAAPAPSPQAAPPTAAPADAPVVPPKPPQDPLRARITFSTIPPTNAKVVWGKTTLGTITSKQALTVIRPRDTGPMDVMVYAPGFLPVQTRAHTFEDGQIIVKLTTPENQSTLWGYRAPLDAGVAPADQVPVAPEEVSQQTPL
jgi:type IV secretory pathway VirB10-like protein